MKVGDMVKVYGLSDELQQLAIQCLKYSGFLALHGVGELYCSDDGRMYPMVANKLTLEEWCFSVAPDWADRIELWEMQYYWSDGKNCSLFGSDTYHPIGYDKADKVLLRRSVLQEWDGKPLPPPVGTRCLINKGVEVTIEKVHQGQVLSVRDDGYMYLTRGDIFKPLPKYTEEQLTAYEMYCDHTKARGNSVPSTIDKFLSQPNVYGGVIYFNLAKAGYKKCN